MSNTKNDKLTCIISKQVLEEKLEIGLMVKAQPSNQLDSGWSFLSGLESEEHFENPDYMSVISIDEVLILNNKISKFLDCPVETVVAKSDNGDFYILDGQKENSQILFNQDNLFNLNLTDGCKDEKQTNLYDETPSDINELSKNDFENIKQFICDNFGDFDGVYKEIVSEKINCNICIVPPNETNNFYKIITIGASALDMNIPQELENKNLELFELVIFLPNDWEFQFDKIFQDEVTSSKWYMPINILKNIARLPFEYDTWIGYGHTICFNDNLKLGEFKNFVLDVPNNLLETKFLKLENGKIVNFYCVIPVLNDEMDFILDNNVENLLEKIYDKNNSQVINIDRKTCLN